jgi:hypothetical protein
MSWFKKPECFECSFVHSINQKINRENNSLQGYLADLKEDNLKWIEKIRLSEASNDYFRQSWRKSTEERDRLVDELNKTKDLLVRLKEKRCACCDGYFHAEESRISR